MRAATTDQRGDVLPARNTGALFGNHDEADRLACAERTATETTEHVRTHWLRGGNSAHSDSNMTSSPRKQQCQTAWPKKITSDRTPTIQSAGRKTTAPDEGKTLRGEPEDVEAASIARLQASTSVRRTLDSTLHRSGVDGGNQPLERRRPRKVKPLMDNGIV